MMYLCVDRYRCLDWSHVISAWLALIGRAVVCRLFYGIVGLFVEWHHRLLPLDIGVFGIVQPLQR